MRRHFFASNGLLYLNEKRFLKYIKGKTIAVVGNGPQQLGKHTGAEIDSADIVVRFNTFELDGYTDNYGTRTDIWINGCGGNYDDKRYLKIARKCKFVIWRSIYDKAKEIESIRRFFKNCLHFVPVYVMRMESQLPLYTMPIFNNHSVTAGCLFLWYLKTYASPHNIKIYGFSFLDPTIQIDELNKMPHFYHKSEVGGAHNMSVEVKVLRDLFKDEIKQGEI
ncbi:MAG: glycosyltransferase family 29 protein [Alphaproteobacteria bacterium]|nr:glycosyltransferase family 29 protein [Alphaproteobacteria bacterium]